MERQEDAEGNQWFEMTKESCELIGLQARLVFFRTYACVVLTESPFPLSASLTLVDIFVCCWPPFFVLFVVHALPAPLADSIAQPHNPTHQPRHTKGSLWRLLKDVAALDEELGIEEPDLRNLRGSGRRGGRRGGGGREGGGEGPTPF